jgi:serine/threonine protein kinase
VVGPWEPGALVGQTFGDFELLEEIGRGSMGVVYKASQKSLDRYVALKLLMAEHAANPTFLQRFLTEARAAASLQHPNIVQVYQVGECIAGPYFVMEFIDGPALEALLDRTIGVNWALSLVTKVAEAVQFAHSKGIIHRDLKPGNIMLQHSKRPVVMDFGIAKVIGKGAALTQHGTLIGTPAFMPPEQAGEEPHRIGPHSDVYSLGAVLYTLLAGRPPFFEDTALRTLMAVIAPDPPPPLHSFRPDVPPRVEQVCMKALAKDPAARYPTAQAFADELKRLRAARSSAQLHKPPSSGAVPVASTTLVLVGQGGKQVRLSLPSTVIGRGTECDLVLKSSDVSKRHCRILLRHDQAEIEDLGSRNGTLLNGEEVRRAVLADGDEIDIAGHVFRVQMGR